MAKLVTIKTMLALSASQNWTLTQLHINNAFLNGDLFEEVFMDLPFGYQPKGELKSGFGKLVCQLHKSIYGLKQASRQWNIKFTQVVIKSGSVQSKADYSLFTKGHGASFVAILVYVDDIIVVGPNATTVSEVKNFLKSQFKLKGLGPLKFFLGLEIARSTTGIVICQCQYTLQLLEDFGFLASKPVSALMNPRVVLQATDGDLLDDATPYRRLVGLFLYLTITRPDCCYLDCRILRASGAQCEPAKR